MNNTAVEVSLDGKVKIWQFNYSVAISLISDIINISISLIMLILKTENHGQCSCYDLYEEIINLTVINITIGTSFNDNNGIILFIVFINCFHCFTHRSLASIIKLRTFGLIP